MNLTLEKEERLAMGDKDRGEIRGEGGKVTGEIALAPTTNSLGKRNGAFCGYGG